MTAPDRKRPYRRLTTAQTIIAAAFVLGLGIVLLYLGGRNSLWQDHQGLQALFSNLGGALVVSISLASIWELLGKRNFAQEILEIARTSSDVKTVGLIRIGTNYNEDPDWDKLFQNVGKLDIFVAYARTWRNTHRSRLEKLARMRGARIRLFLPDPDDQDTMHTMSDRFEMEISKLQEAIREAKRDFEELSKLGEGVVEVYFRKGAPVFSCYRFDSVAVLTMYSHRRSRTTVPTLVCEDGGTLYTFIRDELEAIHQSSVCVVD